MKYRVENQLDCFEYHDSELSLISFDEKDLVVSAKYLNIHKGTKENPYDCDMEISLANICFQNVRIFSFETVPGYTIDPDGNQILIRPQIIYPKEAVKEHFIDALKRGFFLDGIEVQQSGECMTLHFEAIAPEHFCAAVSCSNVIVSWDFYRQKAWYESYKQCT